MTLFRPNRREMLAGGVLALSMGGSLSVTAARATGESGIVTTTDGKLRGLWKPGAYVFKGVPYAADTGGSHRFMAPRPVTKWAGIRDAFEFGARAPQSGGDTTAAYGENCCVLNVYTPVLDRSARMPVMLYIHGGGFRGGSGDTPMIEGGRLASRGKAVVVTLNRRLNVLGFASLGSLDPDFADASCAGQLDLLAALRWIQTNIAEFGGDPGRVMVFGLSGGGSSVEVLTIMPGARGLFHRAANMSGSSVFAMRSVGDMEPVADTFIKNLGIDRGQLRKLQDLPYPRLLSAYSAALEAHMAGDYRPVVDGRHIPHAPLTPAALAIGGHLPIIMSRTASEASLWLAADRRNVSITNEQLTRRVAEQFALSAAEATNILDQYRSADPQRTPWELLVALGSEVLVRSPIRRAAEIKADAGLSTVYVSDFDWHSPADGGIWGATHGIDVPFVFGTVGGNAKTAGEWPDGNSRLRMADLGEGERTERISHSQMDAFAAFAKSGNPNNPNMPGWTPFNSTSRPTMVIDDPCRTVDDYRAADRMATEMLPPQDAFAIISGPLFRYGS